MQHLNYIISLLSQAAVILLAGCCVVLLEQFRQWAKEWYLQRKLHPLARSVLANKQVGSLLIELRAKLDADRACVFLFHNGQTFSNNNPLWRVSCTQECCRTGITHEIASMQNLLASVFWDGIAPLFGDCKNCGAGIEAHKTSSGKFIYVIDVHELDDSFFKWSMVARGVSKSVMCPLIDSRKEIVGYLSANYCMQDTLDIKKIKDDLSEAAGNIHFALTEV